MNRLEIERELMKHSKEQLAGFLVNQREIINKITDEGDNLCKLLKRQYELMKVQDLTIATLQHKLDSSIDERSRVKQAWKKFIGYDLRKFKSNIKQLLKSLKN